MEESKILLKENDTKKEWIKIFPMVKKVFPCDIMVKDTYILNGSMGDEVLLSSPIFSLKSNEIPTQLMHQYYRPGYIFEAAMKKTEERNGYAQTSESLPIYYRKEEELEDRMKKLIQSIKIIRELNDTFQPIMEGMRLREEQIESMFEEKLSQTVPVLNSDIRITTSLFPGITKSLFKELDYQITNTEDPDIDRIIFRYRTEWYTIYYPYRFIK